MNFKLGYLVAATLAGSFLMGFGANAMADSTTDIVNALVSKGVLTEEEGALLTKGRTGETEAAAKKKETAIATSYKDGILFESGDKKNSMQINGRINFDSRTYDHDDSDVTAATSKYGADTFDIRRARIGAKFKFLDYYSGEVVLNAVGTDSSSNFSSQTLDVGYLNVAWWKPVQFRVGQFKMPFSLEQLTSSNNIDFVERSFVDAYIPAKEIGAMVHGEPFNGATYALAMSTGKGQNFTEQVSNVANKDVIGRVTVNFAEMMDNKDMVLHLGAAFSKGDQALNDGKSVFGGDRQTESRGAQFFTAPNVTNTYNSVNRTRTALEGVVAYGPVKLQGQWLNANYDYDYSSTVHRDDDIKTWYAEALWTITGESHAERYKAGVFGALKPKNNFDSEKFTGGAWELGMRYSEFDASDFNNTSAMKGAGYAQAKALTAGVKFIANPHVRFMLDYVNTDFSDNIGVALNTVAKVNGQNVDGEKAILFRSQLAF